MKNLIFTILLTSALWSCGTRNVKKTEVWEEVKKEIENSEKSEETKKEERKVEKHDRKDVEDFFENLTPIDSTKPIKKTVEEKEGKKITTYENAAVNAGTKTDKSTKTESTDENIITDTKKDKEFKSAEKSNKTENVKNTKSDKGVGFSLWWLLLLIIPIVIWKFYNIKK